jgi:GWxTD domain-containing protein
MKNTRSLLITIGIFAACLVGLARGERDLPERHRQWLDVTRYIILPQEKEVFLRLETDRDRDLFIEAFWLQRDPTPGTPQNEYQEEHLKRFHFAEARLGRGTPRPGWMTDMGRIHILLGPPHSIERFDAPAGLHPCQVWYYYGDKRKGLPTYFCLLFFQPGGAGEFKLYNPMSDGPHSLLVENVGIGITDYAGAYRKIKQLAPSLANASISMIPGERPFNFMPSPKNNMILADIAQSPTKDVSHSYATHFLRYKGVVTTEYLTHFVESSLQTSLIFDPSTGVQFLNFSISPSSLSIDYYEPKDQYYCNFQLSVGLKAGERTVYQYSKDFPVYISPEDVDRIRGNGIAIQDAFPVIEGDYFLTVLIQNSVGKEFSVSEKNISVPKTSGAPVIVGPVLGFELKDHPGRLSVPFKLTHQKIEVDPRNTFALNEHVVVFFNVNRVDREFWTSGRVRIKIRGLNSKADQAAITHELELKDFPYNETLSITHSIPAREFLPDYYEIKLTLLNGKSGVVHEESAQFIISPREIIPHPVTLAKSSVASNNYLHFYSLAYQYDRMKQPDKAERAYEQAYRMNPDFRQGLIEYAHFLVRIERGIKALDLIESLRDEEELRFDYLLIKGLAHMNSGAYEQARRFLLEGNRIYDSDVRLLNALGVCCFRSGRKQEALDALRASLGLNAGQPNIKRLITEIENSRD